MSPSDLSTIIEEGLLMAFTVIFAVWSLTTYTVRDGKRLISEHASLPLGISFGYAYAGSVAMLTGTFDNLERSHDFWTRFIDLCNDVIVETYSKDKQNDI